MSQKIEDEIREHLNFIYGSDEANRLLPQLLKRLSEFSRQHQKDKESERDTSRVTEKDAILITYGDMVQTKNKNHLQTLKMFLQKYTNKWINTLHILPFYPYSSDDGFSVIDYLQVNPDLGDWEDIQDLRRGYRLMFDAVINHISAESGWFQGYLRGESQFQDYFIDITPGFDTSKVFRPRALPLLTSFQTPQSIKNVWTTFSEDQIDLNFRNTDLLLDVINVLLFYIGNGAEFIRLDAIAFIWKESGTRCIHLPETHRLIQLFRSIFDMVAPWVSIITETNVPHKENISYFGNGGNEAQLVYNFSLPPLTLHTFQTGNTEILSQWADSLSTPSPQTTFFNFLASHDGIGLMPVRGILSESSIDAMIERVQALGGYISYKNNLDGSQTAYELNINFLEALGDPHNPVHDTHQIAQRFLASQSIMLVLQGVPGIYFHSLFGSRSWNEGVLETGRYRSINRQKLSLENLENDLNNPGSLRHYVFTGFQQMLKVRQAERAFHPASAQQVLNIHPSVFGLLRSSQDGPEKILCLTNVSSNEVRLELNLEATPFEGSGFLSDSLSSDVYTARSNKLELFLKPYQVMWLV